MRSCLRRAVVLVVATIGATVLTACSSHGDSSRTLTLYSGQDQATTALLVDAFERKTGFEVKVRSDDEAVLANDLAQPGTSGSADVFYSENTPALRLLELHHLLALVVRTHAGEGRIEVAVDVGHLGWRERPRP